LISLIIFVAVIGDEDSDLSLEWRVWSEEFGVWRWEFGESEMGVWSLEFGVGSGENRSGEFGESEWGVWSEEFGVGSGEWGVGSLN